MDLKRDFECVTKNQANEGNSDFIEANNDFVETNKVVNEAINEVNEGSNDEKVLEVCVGVLESDGLKGDVEYVNKKQRNDANSEVIEANKVVNEVNNEVKLSSSDDMVLEVCVGVLESGVSKRDVEYVCGNKVDGLVIKKQGNEGNSDVIEANEVVNEAINVDDMVSEVCGDRIGLKCDLECVGEYKVDGLVTKKQTNEVNQNVIVANKVDIEANKELMNKEFNEGNKEAIEANQEVIEAIKECNEANNEVIESSNGDMISEVCVGVLKSGGEKIGLKRDLACVANNKVDEPCTKKQTNEVNKEFLEASKEVKEASNEEMISDVSNPHLSPENNAAISSTKKPVSGNSSNKQVVSDEESLSEEESSKNNKPISTTTSFVREIPEHISSGGIRKITFKLSKPREDYMNKSLVPYAEDNNGSVSYQRYGETDKSKKLFGESQLTNVKKLLSSGILEGARVKYVTTSKRDLPGIVMDWGYLCGCLSCNFNRILSAYEFELHAGGSTKHPNKHIFMENGRPIYAIIQELKTAPLSMIDEVIRNVAGSAVNEEIFQAWRARIQQKIGKITAENYEEERRWMAEMKKPITHYPSLSSYKKKSSGGTRKRDNDLHRVLFMPGGLPDGAVLAYYSRGQRILEGFKHGNGIICSHCQTEISPSLFEAHAGWSVRRQPYRNIYTSNGLTLHDIALSLASGEKMAAGKSDDMCAVCGNGGDLVFCDGCPRSFHEVCLDLEFASNRDWHCPFCREKVGMGQKIVGEPSNMEGPNIAPEIEAGGCVVCRASDFNAEIFDDRTIIICDQCEKEYHVGCLRDRGFADLKELPKHKWFCCDDCTKIYVVLRNLVLVGAEAIPTLALRFINMKALEIGFRKEAATDVQWRILSGKSHVSEHLPVLSAATAIFQDCFDPIEATSGRDLIPLMVYGRNISGQEFAGMYCVVLIIKSVVVSAGLLRILGRDAAEIPLVATSKEHQGKGYFQALFSCIERLLYSLNVKNIVVPSAEEAESLWTKKFGFRKMSNEQFMKYLRDLQLTSFKGSSMLEKQVQQQ